jgi:hypothetical protein
MATGITTSKTRFDIKVGTGALTKIGGVTGFSGLGGGSSAVIDTTDLDSSAKEKAMGVPDEGQVTITMIATPKDVGQIALRTARATQAKAQLTITLTDGTKYVADVYVLTFERNGDQDDVIKISCNMEITGAVTETVGT